MFNDERHAKDNCKARRNDDPGKKSFAERDALERLVPKQSCPLAGRCGNACRNRQDRNGPTFA